MLLNPAFKVGIDVSPETVLEPVARVVATFSSGTAKSSGTSLLVFDSSVEDDGWGWSTGTQFTVPSGVELVVATCMVRGNAVQGDDNLHLQKNTVNVTSRLTDDHFFHPDYERVVLPVTAGDVLRWQLYAQNGFTMQANTTRVSFTGY